MEDHPPYLTLSHCWGNIQLFKLKKDNIDRLFDRIPTEELCKTFLDTMVVARAFGIKYIWIDSLCIIQDDEDDWRRESALMSDVYGYSTVNIAATHARDGSAGLFVDRDLFTTTRHFTQTTNKETYELIDNGLYDRCVTYSPLASRGWVFQERFLARRTIHFTAEQIFCECREHTSCEAFPEATFQQAIPFGYRFQDIRSPGLEGWAEVIKFYSRLKLTYPRDKLVAISGVARRFQDGIGDDYVAGLWRDDLAKQMLWRENEEWPIFWVNEEPQEAEATEIPFRAPSWSWASTDEPITWALFGTRDALEDTSRFALISTEDIEIVLAGEDELGAVRDAKLRIISGPLIHTQVEGLRNRQQDSTISMHINKELSIQGHGRVWYDHDKDYDCGGDGIYFLPILEDVELSSCLGIAGLMITAAENRERGYFKRLGVFDVQLQIPDEPDHCKLMVLLSANPSTLMDESLYEEILEPDENDTNQYIITLV
jgi:hypothetical protein